MKDFEQWWLKWLETSRSYMITKPKGHAEAAWKSQQEKIDELESRLNTVNMELEIQTECCWCILHSITDEDDRQYLKDTLTGEKSNGQLQSYC